VKKNRVRWKNTGAAKHCIPQTARISRTLQCQLCAEWPANQKLIPAPAANTVPATEIAFGRTPARASKLAMALAHFVSRDFSGRRVMFASGFNGVILP